MPHFFLRLVPVRPTFAYDMSEAERAKMSEHAAYLEGLTKTGVGVAFGPVFDPKGPWGMGILETEDEGAARVITDKDPAVIAGLGQYEIAPMRLSFRAALGSAGEKG